jgi:hypothetical protein
MFALLSKPTQPPAPSSWVGCFAAPNASPLSFDGAHISFGQHGMAPVKYAMSLQKYGTIAIEPRPPIHFSKAQDGSQRFAPGDSGLLYMMRLAHVVGGKVYGVLKVEDAEYVEVGANDGSVTAFRPADPAACR